MDAINYVQPGSDYLKVEKKTGSNQELDKDTFIKLLLTQMKYQDPLNPMDNQEMMAQLAQFTALEQMKNVANSAEKQVAYSILGKTVEYLYEDPETGEKQKLVGTVSYVKANGSEILMGIGDKEVKLNDISAVVDAASVQKDYTAYELIGRTVQGVIQDEMTKEDIIVEGKVLSVNMKGNKPYVVIGTGKKTLEIDLQNIQNVVEKPSLTDKTITASIINDKGETVEVEGIVEYVIVKKSGTYLYVNETLIDFNNIETIK